MCNLYRHTSNVEAIRELTGAMNRPNLPVFGDIYPNYEALIVRNSTGGREIATLKWGVPLATGEGKKPKAVTNVRNLTSPF